MNDNKRKGQKAQGSGLSFSSLKLNLEAWQDHFVWSFVDAMQRMVPKNRDLREIPQAQARPTPKSLAHYAQTYSDRNGAIAAAYASGGYTMQEIGDYFGLHYSWISKILQREVQEKAKEKRKT